MEGPAPVLDAFGTLKRISRYTRLPEQDAVGRDELIRFLDRYSGSGPELPIVDSLCAHFGLYPYMSPGTSNAYIGTSEALAVEFHTPSALAEEGFTFHAMQQEIYQRLMDRESLILSAPTSFGKSVIIDALVASEQWSNFVLVVPTIALVDETRRRLARFSAHYKVSTHPTEQLAERNILVMTQERLLEVEVLPAVDFFMIDEFYKLGSGGARDGRRALLNLAWKRLVATGAQYYLIGPNIDHLDERIPQDLRSHLVTTDFRTVAVDIEDRSGVSADQQQDDLKLLLESGVEGSTLVFTGSPARAENLGTHLGTESAARGIAAEVSVWMAANYDPDWSIVEGLQRGIAVHTGPLPRSLQRIMVRLFNENLVATMVCTSTLIEGVNTAAQNVVIFAKKIDRQLIDFFTFSNIRGRAGRMFQHFLGRVITYMPPPENVDTTVDIPIESQSDLASDAVLVQIPNEELDVTAKRRVESLYEQDQLSLETIRRNRGMDPSLQVALADRLWRMSPSQAARISWTGFPTNEEARAVLRLAFEELLEPYQRTGMNFEMLWGQLQNVRRNHEDFSAMVDSQRQYARPNETRSDTIRRVLQFQRNWMGFTIPAMLRGVASIQSEVFRARQLPAGNYELYLRDIESLYETTPLVELEEYGVPLPLARRLTELGMAGSDVPTLLESLLGIVADPRVLSVLGTVEQWILEDVVAGLTGRPINA